MAQDKHQIPNKFLRPKFKIPLTPSLSPTGRGGRVRVYFKLELGGYLEFGI